MMRHRQQFSLKKFIKRAVFITLVLALAEVAILFFLMPGKKGKNQQLKPPEKKIQTSKIAEKVIDKTTDKTYHSIADSAATQIPAHTKDSIAGNATDHPDAVVTMDTVVKNTVPGMLPKKLSRLAMTEIFNSIAAAKRRNHNKQNCVQLRKTSTSNIINAFKIADFLRSKGYIISGRIIIPGYQKGIRINTEPGCTLLTIGSL